MGLKSWCPQGCLPSGCSKGEFIPYLFQLVKDAHIPWFVAPIHFQSQQSHLSELGSCHHISSASDSSLLLSLIRTFEITLGPPNNARYSPHLKICKLITPAKALLPCKGLTHCLPH